MRKCFEFMTEAVISAAGGVFVLGVVGLIVLVSDVNGPSGHAHKEVSSSYLEREMS